ISNKHLHFTLYISSLTLYSYHSFFFCLIIPPPPRSTLFPYTTLFRSVNARWRPDRIWPCPGSRSRRAAGRSTCPDAVPPHGIPRSEEHTSELQSPYDLVCRLLLEKKKEQQKKHQQHQ